MPKIMLVALLMVLLILSISMAIYAQKTSENPGESQIITNEFQSEILDRIYQYHIYLPAGYDTASTRYPVIYMLHGRGDTMSAWLNARSTLDDLIASGDIPPLIAVMPDMPSNERASYYIDSAYTGHLFRAESVETAFFDDLIPHIDTTYRTLANRRSRMITGYSMGGYGAIRYVLSHPDHFLGAIILSPAVYTPLPPEDSSTREFGSFGKETALFDAEIYTQLNYPALLEDWDSEYRLNLFIAVGDDEWKHPKPEDMEHDLDFESHRFFNRVARVSGIASEFRVYNGGHDWDVWLPGFREGIRYLANYIDSTDSSTESTDTSPDGWLTGTTGDDLAGGITVERTTGVIYQALAVADALPDQSHAGNLDIAVIKYDANRQPVWIRQMGTSGNDRPYGIVMTEEKEVVTVGYTQGNFDGKHNDNAGDDIVVLKLNDDGEILWKTQIGTPFADRGYAIATAPDDRIVISGYTKGDLASENNGDKDIITAMLNSEGEVLWIHQIGGDGEDKGQAITVGEDGTIYSAGMTTSALTDSVGGAIDAFILELTPSGALEQVRQFGTSEWDEITGAVVDKTGQLIVTGFTASNLVYDLNGDKDIFMMVFDENLEMIKGDQIGTNLNDKGAALVLVPTNDGEELFVAGYSDGDIAGNVGDFDVVLLHYDVGYNRLNIWQIGTNERDGTDQWAEKNLFITFHDRRILLSGLTLGDIGTSTISGGSDVFIIEPDLDAK